MSPAWELPTATGVYRVGLAPDDLGPVFLSWTDPGEAPEVELPLAGGWDLPADVLPLEYAVFGTRQRQASELIVDHGDGLVGARVIWDSDGELIKDGTGTTLRVRAVDSTGRLELELRITADTEHDVITKRAVITNVGRRRLILPRAFAPAWDLPVPEPPVIDFLAGDWAREFGTHRVTLPAGTFTIGSRQGVTSHSYAPVIAVGTPGGGPGYGVALAWSGSWRLAAEVVPGSGRVRIGAGVDDESCVITLDPGESYATPESLGVRAPEGVAGLPGRWHDHQRRVLSRDIGPAHRPIVYNSWYATEFDVRPEHQTALAEVAAEIGAEVFVVDDGWFAGRTSDRAGLGDWTPDPVKFPQGLAPLITSVTDLGMRFGLWVEPEAVNPDSELFRSHPDWVYRAGDRPLVTVRNQYLLDFGRPEVVAWCEETLRRLLADHRISYLKWDMNRPVSDGGRPGDDHGRQWSVQHVEGYHRVLRMLRDEFGHVTVEACSSGGGRIDAAVLALTDVVWTSDETGPRARLAIQHGFLSAFGSHLMSSWVTDQPDRRDPDPASFEFRFLVAMAGVLGVGSDLLAWTAAERARAAELIKLYRELRPTIQQGRVERHGEPADPVYALEYGTADRTVILVYGRPGRPDRPKIIPRTLRPGERFRVRGGDRVITAGSAVEIGFAVADDCHLLVLDRVDPY
ncbi:alpha-galactosidase [Microlunatus parietis]|uniref:alpha-galactosidase n=1 Tax=Microlunatus parietis TaxID=682979 RepID=A0A7Y9IEB5_9ACTN|nr:alpha-galactosidase [Microlunatus parietis]NYE75036.1 alpha-galactosidase [Microlunatus parietis]